ncbi:MAG: hypothetical protein HQL34_14070, partial [Alphaproteobacteria bacterium]|nr:hypothetical protein [Alphaproteobacteria bacterium]
SLYRWIGDRTAASSPAALAPKAVPEADIPVWASAFITLYQRPTQPGIAEVLDDKNWPTDVAKPSYDQARRLVKSMDAVSRNMGRMGLRALRAFKAFRARDVSKLWPGAAFIGDGHTFKREVAHPVSGRPMRPEVTVILDIFTRKWVGWSLDLAENT